MNINQPDALGQGTGPRRSDSGDGSSHRARRLLLAIAALTVLPFVFVWRALENIWATPPSRNILIAGAWLIVAGTFGFMIIESLSPIDAFYFSFITLTTIGYGDIAPQTDIGKTATVIYGLVGLGVFAALIGTIAAQRPHLRRRHGIDPGDDNDEAE